MMANKPEPIKKPKPIKLPKPKEMGRGGAK